MKVVCISTCQKDRKTVYVVGKEYDIPENMYKKNKEFFKKVGKATEEK